MEIKRAAQLQDRFQRERSAGSILTGPRYSTAGGPGGDFEKTALNAAEVHLPLPLFQQPFTGKIYFTVGISAIGDGSEIAPPTLTGIY